MHIFYTPGIQSNEYQLTEEESKHCVKVLRLKEQDTVYLTDGVGGFYHAIITEANVRKCQVEVYQTYKEYGKRNYHLSIAIAPTKNIERFEWFLEKSTEIGIDRIIPIISQQSERKLIKPDRLKKIIIEAVKQSKQAYLPELEALYKFNEFIKMPFDGKKLIAYCSESSRKYLKDTIEPGQNTLILIGPEGDFSPGELETAWENGFVGVSLGNNRLRTETAGVVACHTLALVNQ